MTMSSHKDFGRKPSTPHAMHPTEFISTASWERHPMSFSLGGSPTSPTFGCLVANATYSRKGYRVFNSATSKIEETCDVEFDETNGSQGEVFYCDDVGDEPLREVMKNITIGQVKPKKEVEELQA